MVFWRQIKKDKKEVGAFPPPLPFSVGCDSCTPALTAKRTTDADQVDRDPKLRSISPLKAPVLLQGDTGR